MRAAIAALFVGLASCQAIPPAPEARRHSADLEDAIRNDDADAVRRFVKADPDALKQPLRKGMMGETDSPLHLAADRHKVAAVRVLLELGADPNFVQSKRDCTPLMEAASSGPSETAELLLKAGAKLDPCCAAALGKTKELRAMLDEAKKAGREQEVLNGSAGGAWRGGSVLNWAVHGRQYETAKLLLERGADPNPARDECGINEENPLHTAVRERAWSLIPLLMAHGANPELRDYDGDTPLHKAVTRYGEPDLVAVALLILGGAKQTGRTTWHATRVNDIGITNSVEGWDPRVGGFTSDLAVDLKSRETGETPLHRAAEQGFTGTVLLMLALGVDPNPECRTGSTPLDFAVRRGHTTTAQVLKYFGGRTGGENRAFGELAALRIERPAWVPPRAGDPPDEFVLPMWTHPRVTPELVREMGARWGNIGSLQVVWYKDLPLYGGWQAIPFNKIKPLPDCEVPPVWFGGR